MISFEASAQSSKRLQAMPVTIASGAEKAMQNVIDKLVENIQGHFDDESLAQTVTGFIDERRFTGDAFEITGLVTSTWANMIWYEKGRQPGGKMPPKDAILRYAARHNITPDPERSALAFAFAINVARQRKGKHRLPVSVLVEWQNRTGIVVPEDFAMNSMAYAIAKKIQRDGIPGRHYFEMGLDDTRDFITDSFENVVIATTGF